MQASISLAERPVPARAVAPEAGSAASGRGGRKGHKPPHMGRDEREALAEVLLAMGQGEERSTFFAQLARASGVALARRADARPVTSSVLLVMGSRVKSAPPS